MCDYSQHGLPNRLACEGELLLTHRFPTQLIGLASALEMEETERRHALAQRGWTWLSAVKRWLLGGAEARQITAVCIPPGARLRMSHIPAEVRDRWALRAVEDVWFTQTGDLERYRDAIRFGNGRLMLLQMLPEDVCFMVLSMGSDDGPKQVRIPVWRDDVLGVIGARGW